jgi:uncharacterized membrane protein
MCGGRGSKVDVGWLLTPLTPTISVAEVIWALSGVLGMLFELRVSRRRLRQWAARRRSARDPGEWIVLRVSLERAALLLGVHLLILATGAHAMTVPEPIRTEVRVEQVVTTAGVLLIAVLCMAITWRADVGQRDFARHVRAHPQAAIRAVRAAAEEEE